MPAGSITDKQHARPSSQLSDSSRAKSPLSKGVSRAFSVTRSGQGNLQRRETDNEECQALEPEGNGVLSALMEGIQSDFQSLVKLAAKFVHVMLIMAVPWIAIVWGPCR